MKVYLAHNFGAREWLRDQVNPLVESAGHIVTSRWVTDDVHCLPRQQNAVDDVEDLRSTSTVIVFVDQFSDRPGKGKFVEWGLAIGFGKQVILVGSDESCVFYHLPNMRRAATIEEAIQLI